MSSRGGYTDELGYATGTALGAALTPAFSTPVKTADGFTFDVTNYVAAFTYSATSTSGTVSINSSGHGTVTGLTPGGSAIVTVTTGRAGYAGGSAGVAGTALAAGTAATFSASTSTSAGSPSRSATYNSGLNLHLQRHERRDGDARRLDGRGERLAAGASSTVTVTVTNPGVSVASSTANGSALQAGLTPVLTAPVSRRRWLPVQRLELRRGLHLPGHVDRGIGDDRLRGRRDGHRYRARLSASTTVITTPHGLRGRLVLDKRHRTQFGHGPGPVGRGREHDRLHLLGDELRLERDLQPQRDGRHRGDRFERPGHRYRGWRPVSRPP